MSSLIKKHKWNKALQLLNSKQGRQQISKNRQQQEDPTFGVGPNDDDGYFYAGLSLLTLAILHNAPVDIINAFLRQDHLATVIVGQFGMSPLHVACACGSSFAVIKALTQHDRENGLPNTAIVVDKCRRTPLHHLMHHLCFPKSVDKGRAIFGNGPFSSGNSAASSSVASFGSIPNRMSMNQDELEECLITLRYLAQLGPKAAFCRDIDGYCPIDILHECKASHASESRTPSWERADIGCLTLRSETMMYYQSEKVKAEERPSKLEKTASVDGTSSMTDGSSIMSGSILSGLSKLEVDSLSLGQMDLSVCSRNRKTGTKWEG